jgi:glycosyltransferase involved in cell wall biosynthesis
VSDLRPRVVCLMQLPPPVHGASVMNETVARSDVLKSRFAIDVVPMHFAETLADVGKNSVRKVPKVIATGARLTKELVTKRPHAVYVTFTPHGAAFYRDCLYVAIMKALCVPRIYHLHGKGIASQLSQGWKMLLYRWAFRDAYVIALSPLLGRDIEDVVSADRIAFVGNGVRDQVTDVPHRVGRTGPPRILYLSNMMRTKGALVLLEALVTLHRRGVAFDATFVGADPRDGSVDEFRSTVAAHGLGSQVRYLGPIYGEAKDALFRDSDLFVFPTFYAPEAFPLVLLEAMQWALPIISTPEGAIPEIVSDGETGFLVRQQDAEALADRIAYLLQEPQRRREMGEQGRKRYLGKYTLEHFEHNLAAAIARGIELTRG